MGLHKLLLLSPDAIPEERALLIETTNSTAARTLSGRHDACDVGLLYKFFNSRAICIKNTQYATRSSSFGVKTLVLRKNVAKRGTKFMLLLVFLII